MRYRLSTGDVFFSHTFRNYLLHKFCVLVTMLQQVLVHVVQVDGCDSAFSVAEEIPLEVAERE